MSVEEFPTIPAELGFPPLSTVSTLRSIAQLFGATKSRCGIYLLAFPSRTFYIGQAVDVVRRFAQHRQTYEQIIGFSFLPTPKAALDATERDLIHKSELLNLVILNTIHASVVVGETDLDLVLSQADQQTWLESPTRFNSNDNVIPIALSESQLERFRNQFQVFQKHSLFAPASDILKTYIQTCVPAPSRTEYSFWVVSCMPSTNRNSWPRLLCVSAGIMELLVVGVHKSSASKMWGFVTVASDVLLLAFESDLAIVKAFPSIEVTRNNYRDAGQHQITLQANDEQTLKAILEHEAVRRAAAALALRVMRKRATIYTKFHCKQLADSALRASA